MGEISYAPLIHDMTWSYSRLHSFDQCKNAWFLKYIRRMTEAPRFYSSFGSFMHKLIERYYRGELSKEEMLTEYFSGFSENVLGDRPKEPTASNYVKSGIGYLENFREFPFKMIDVEKKIETRLGGMDFVGFIDFLGETDGGKLVIVDNKSRNLSERSGREKPTRNDETLDDMLRQLYLYAEAVKQELGEYPELLCFNCFRNGNFIQEKFSKDKCDEAVEWAKKTEVEIEEESDFPANIDPFFCRWICGLTWRCEDFQEYVHEGRHRR